MTSGRFRRFDPEVSSRSKLPVACILFRRKLKDWSSICATAIQATVCLLAGWWIPTLPAFFRTAVSLEYVFLKKMYPLWVWHHFSPWPPRWPQNTRVLIRVFAAVKTWHHCFSGPERTPRASWQELPSRLPLENTKRRAAASYWPVFPWSSLQSNGHGVPNCKQLNFQCVFHTSYIIYSSDVLRFRRFYLIPLRTKLQASKCWISGGFADGCPSFGPQVSCYLLFFIEESLKINFRYIQSWGLAVASDEIRKSESEETRMSGRKDFREKLCFSI